MRTHCVGSEGMAKPCSACHAALQHLASHAVRDVVGLCHGSWAQCMSCFSFSAWRSATSWNRNKRRCTERRIRHEHWRRHEQSIDTFISMHAVIGSRLLGSCSRPIPCLLACLLALWSCSRLIPCLVACLLCCGSVFVLIFLCLNKNWKEGSARSIR